MPARRPLVAAATATLVVAAALGAYLLPGRNARQPRSVLDERRAREVTEGYRRDTVARIAAGLRYAEAARSYAECPSAPGRYIVSSRYDLTPDSSSAVAFTTLRAYWRQRGYRILNDTSGENLQLLVENPTDGFRIGVSQRTARYIRLAISSPCLVPAAPPVTPVVPQDLAAARGGYEKYVGGILAQLAGDVAALRAAVHSGDTARARTAWLTAQLRWERVGAAYGSFGDLADAIDGLPQGLPAGTSDPAFIGLHRIEYGLWHGESRTSLLRVVDRLSADVARLHSTLAQVAPAPADLPLRAHEILEDAQRDHLTGLTDFGSGAGLAETLANVDATTALLGVLGPLVDARRPGLLAAIHTGLAALRTALLAARDGTTWPAPDAADPAARRRVDAALGGVLETLAAVPGLLEVAGS